MKINHSPAVFLFLLISQFYLASASAETLPEVLEPIVVRQLPYGSASRGPVTAVLTGEDIEKISANTPQELLNYLGVDVQTRGPYGVKSDISLNASTFQQVLILVNGMRVKDTQTAHQDLDLFFNVDDIERIEIIPAARSSVYGPDGVGGAINFILKKADKGENSLSASFGNYDTYEQKLNLSGRFKQLRNRFSFANAVSEGARFDTDFRTDTFFNSATWEKDDIAIFIDSGYSEKEYGAYDFYTPARGYPSKEWVNTKFIDVRTQLKKERFTFEPHANYREHFDKFMLTIRNPGLYLNHHRTDTYQVGAVLTVPFTKGDLVFGADFGEEKIQSNNLGKHVRDHWNVYLDPSFALGPWTTLNTAVRIDDYTTFKEEVTGSVSLKHSFNEKSDSYVVMGRNIRIPTFTELYYSDSTTAGNPDLKPEQAYNFEAGYHRKLSEKLDATISFFYRHENDTIDYTKLTSLDPKFIARNISMADTLGLNIYSKWEATDNTAFDLRYIFNNKRQKADGFIYKYGLNHIKHLIDFGMDTKLNRWKNRVDVIMKKKPTRRDWVLVNDMVSFDAWKDLELFFEVYNLFNVEHQEIVGIPEPDRLFKVGLKYSW